MIELPTNISSNWDLMNFGNAFFFQHAHDALSGIFSTNEISNTSAVVKTFTDRPTTLETLSLQQISELKALEKISESPSNLALSDVKIYYRDFLCKPHPIRLLTLVVVEGRFLLSAKWKEIR